MIVTEIRYGTCKRTFFLAIEHSQSETSQTGRSPTNSTASSPVMLTLSLIIAMQFRLEIGSSLDTGKTRMKKPGDGFSLGSGGWNAKENMPACVVI